MQIKILHFLFNTMYFVFKKFLIQKDRQIFDLNFFRTFLFMETDWCLQQGYIFRQGLSLSFFVPVSLQLGHDHGQLDLCCQPLVSTTVPQVLFCQVRFPLNVFRPSRFLLLYETSSSHNRFVHKKTIDFVTGSWGVR